MQAARHTSPESQIIPGQRPRILYAEDQASARVVTTALLQRLGYDVDAVEDGELALGKAQARRYDVILLDIEMPVMDGATAAARIRKEAQPCKDVPILALSAFLADSTEACGWRKLFDHALPKPATALELKAAVSRFITRSQVKMEVEPAASLAGSFRQVLPTNMWQRLADNAADEMKSLTLTIAACSDAEDWEVLTNSLRALKCLAMNFDAKTVVELVDQCQPGVAADGRLMSLHVGRWREQAIAA